MRLPSTDPNPAELIKLLVCGFCPEVGFPPSKSNHGAANERSSPAARRKNKGPATFARPRAASAEVESSAAWTPGKLDPVRPPVEHRAGVACSSAVRQVPFTLTASI